jgi:hypothetical protein
MGAPNSMRVMYSTSLLSEWSASRLGRFNPRERAPGTHWMGGWVGGRSGRGGEEKNYQPLPGLEPPIIQPVAQR